MISDPSSSGCCDKEAVLCYFLDRTPYSPGLYQTPYITADDLELWFSHLYLPSAGMTGLCLHTLFFCSTGGGWTQGFMHIKQLLDQLSYIPRQEKLRSWFISFCAPAGNFSLDISAACLPQFYSLNSVNMLLGEPSKELSGLWFCRSLGLHLYFGWGTEQAD